MPLQDPGSGFGPVDTSAADPLLAPSTVQPGIDSPVETLASYGQLLSPPSYSDSILMDKGEIQPESLKQEIHVPTSPLQVIVSDPVKRVEGSVIPGVAGGYVTYKVQTKTQLPSYRAPELLVRRRFKDFVVRTHSVGKALS